MPQWEMAGAMPALVVDCCHEISTRGCSVEGVFRIPGSGDFLAKLRKQYDAGEIVDLGPVDVHTVASLLSLWLRELPEGLLSEKAAETLLSVADEERARLHEHLESAVSGPALLVLGELLLACHELVQSVATTKMTTENLAVCLTPDLIRSGRVSNVDGGAQAMGSLRLAAQYGRLVRKLIEAAPTLFSRATSTASTSTAGDVGGTTKLKKPFKEKRSGRPKQTAALREARNLGQVVAIASHVAENETELSFEIGDQILIHQIDPTGMWYGEKEHESKIGLFPAAKTNASGVVKARQVNLLNITGFRKQVSPIGSPRELTPPSTPREEPLTPPSSGPEKPPKPPAQEFE